MNNKNKKILKFILLMTIVIFFPFVSKSQWEKIETVPAQFQKTLFLDVLFLDSDPNYGWACGYQGKVIRTTDGGKTWSGVFINDIQLESIHFVDKNNGYTSGSTSIFKSTDGGITWRDVTPTPRYYGQPYSLWGCFFMTKDIGLVIGGGCGTDRQVFHRTTDGGLTWTQFFGIEANSGLTDIVMFSIDGLGYVSSSGRIWITNDGGRTWQIFCNSGAQDWQEELTIAGNTLLVPYSGGCTGGGVGGMRISTNLGQTWKQTYTGQPMFGSFLLDSLRGWVCGHKRSMYYTSDGGKTWVLRNCGIDPEDSLDDVWFCNDTLGYVVGNGVYRFTNTIDSAKIQITAEGPTSVCPGEKVNLRATLKEQNKTYDHVVWSTGETTYVITVDKPGDYWCYAFNDSCDKGVSNKITIKFNPKPAINITSDRPEPHCMGDKITISVNPKFPAYLWSTKETTDAITVSSSGTYTVSVTDSNGCKWSQDFVIDFKPNPKPMIDSVIKVNPCVNDSINLITNPGFITYTWFDTAIPEPLQEGGNTYVVRTDGQYYVKVTNEFGCVNYSDTIKCKFRLDTNQIMVVFEGGTHPIFIDSCYIPFTECRRIQIKNYSWKPFKLYDVYIKSNREFSIPQSQFPISINPYDTASILVCYAPSTVGIERDTLLFPDICWQHVVSLYGLGVANEFEGDTKCNTPIKAVMKKKTTSYSFNPGKPYPNPASDGLSVPFSRYITDNYSPSEACIITNVLGYELARASMEIQNQTSDDKGLTQQGSFQLNTQSLTQGYYFVRIISNDGIFIFPIVIEK